jgi:serine/threonine-protein kinase
MPLETLKDWLPDIARAIDFVHSQHHVHRDVKPANILFDRHGNSFLGDFGIIKALTSEATDCRGNSLTAPGFLVGTPNYVAPEIVMGRPWDGRVDQYSLAMTVYEVLTGNNCMEGPTPSATVVNQTMVVPPPLTEVLPEVPPRLSNAILRGLAKDPQERFESCLSLAQEIMADVPSGGSRPVAAPLNGLATRGEPGKVPCPACGAISPVGREHAGSRIRCINCQAVSYVQILSRNTLQLKLLEHPPTRDPVVIDMSDEDDPVDATAATVQVERPGRHSQLLSSVANTRALPRVPHRSWLIAGALSLVTIAGALALARTFRSTIARDTAVRDQAAVPLVDGSSGQPGAKPAPPTEAAPLELNIAFGTEKQRWLEQVTAEFQKTPDGKKFKVNLHGMGSMEGAQAVLEGPGTVPIQVWSPASGAYRDLFEREWMERHSKSPIIKSENLALTPMVFVFWKTRREAFLQRYGKVDFQTIGQAMREPGGWGAIARHPEWGRFKFGHTHPNRSNSGLVTLVLMAQQFVGKEQGSSLSGTTQRGFSAWLESFEGDVARPGGSLSPSTGTLMREMVLRGPSQYDCLLVYENLAIDYLEAARDRWGELHVDYPDPNIWNEHPYYILDVPWSTQEQRAAAATYLRFLMSEPVQKQALEHGFRPGNPEVSVRYPQSTLVRLDHQGLKIDLPRMCEPPKADGIKKLLSTFSRIESSVLNLQKSDALPVH